ncbi:Acyl-CoA N-acyltransferase (NAT) superfamily protein [Zea mays]|nr:Acyl-CoA N-acyltransferase (NAT) superfamily protein [Zea mays]
MLLLAIDAAKLNGAENIYIHVHKDNLPAWRLYDQIGFKIVDQDDDCRSSDLCLLSFSS